MIPRIATGCIALCVLTCVSIAEEPKEAKLKPTAKLSGSHSAIKRETIMVVTDESTWNGLWAKHRAKEQALFTESDQSLNIDFDTHYVVAIFTGWVSSTSVTTFTRGDAVLIRYSTHSDCTEGRDMRTEQEKAKDAAVAEYCFVVLPKPVKTVIVEKDVRRQLIDDEMWEEKVRFPAR